MPKQPREARLSFRFSDGTTEALPLPAVVEAALRQWHALAQSSDPATKLAAQEAIKRASAQQAMLVAENIAAAHQRRTAGAAKKPARRSPLRQAIVEAMRPLRAEGYNLHQALLSLAQSPKSALRLRKEGADWHCQNEDEDWPPELLTRAQLTELFKAAAKKSGS